MTTMLLSLVLLLLLPLRSTASGKLVPSPSRSDPPPIYISRPPTHSVFEIPTTNEEYRYYKKKGKKKSKYYHHPKSVEGTPPDDDLYLLFPNPIAISPPGAGKGSRPQHTTMYPPAAAPMVIPPVDLTPSALPPYPFPVVVVVSPVAIPPVALPPAHLPMVPHAEHYGSSYPKETSRKKQLKRGEAGPYTRDPSGGIKKGVGAKLGNSDLYTKEGASGHHESPKVKGRTKKTGEAYKRHKSPVRSKEAAIPVAAPTTKPASEGYSSSIVHDGPVPIAGNDELGVYAMYNPDTEMVEIKPSTNDTGVIGLDIDPISIEFNPDLDLFQIVNITGVDGLGLSMNPEDDGDGPIDPPLVESQLIDPASMEDGPIDPPPAIQDDMSDPPKPPPPSDTTSQTATSIDTTMGIQDTNSTDTTEPVDYEPVIDVLLVPVDAATISAPATLNPVAAPVAAPVTTSAPLVTTVPTSYPVLQIEETTTRSVTADPVYLRITGFFNPSEEEAVFFDVLQENFEPYGRAYIGTSALKDIEVDVEFFDELTLAVEPRQRTSTDQYSSWSEIIVTFSVSLDQDMDIDQASQIVRRFFVASHKERFTNRLKEAGIEVTNMIVFEEVPDAIKTLRGQLDDDDYSNIGEVPVIEEDGSSRRSNRSSAIVAAVLSALIVLMALGCVIFSNRRRQRHRFSHVQIEKEDVEYDNISSDSQSNRMTTLHSDDEGAETLLRPGHGKSSEAYFKTVMSCNSTISSYPSFAQQNTGTGESGYCMDPLARPGDPEETKREDQEVEERAMILFNDSPDLIAAAALAATDASSVDPQNTTIDFLDDHAEPQSPMWSLDNYSNATPEEDHAVARRRWHDMANDMDSIGLPDHQSEPGQSNRDGEEDEEEEEKLTIV